MFAALSTNHRAPNRLGVRRLATIAVVVALGASTLVQVVGGDAFVSAETTGPFLDGAAAGEQFGQSVDRDGGTHLVGGASSAVVIERTGDVWSDPIPLVPPGGNPPSYGFASAIDMANDGLYGIAVVGAPFDTAGGADAGSAHVFEYTPATGWEYVEGLTGAADNMVMGAAVDVQLLADERTANIVVGAENRDGIGSVDSWVRQAGVSSGYQTITGTFGDDVGDRFGSSVALDGATLVVGAPQDNDGGSVQIHGGTASIFDGDPAGALAGGMTMAWVEMANVSFCDVVAPGEIHPYCGNTPWSANIGTAVAIDGDLMAVGSPRLGSSNGGTVLVLERDGAEWTIVTRLTHDGWVWSDRFGHRLAIDDGVVAVQAELRNGENGSVHFFSFDGVEWSEYLELAAEGDGIAGARFGTGLALEGTAATIGAPFDDFFDTTDSGSILEYITTVPLPNYPPDAVSDEYSTFPGDVANLTVLNNDSDPEGEELYVSAIPQQAANGTVAITFGGSAVSYTPDSGFSGVDTFSYTANDGARTADAVVTVTVGSVLAIGDLSVDESVGLAEVVVTIDASAPDGVSFDVAMTPGTATTPGDYTVGLTSFAVEPGGSGTTISIPIVDDDRAEADEQFTVAVSNVVGAAVVDGEAVVTITDRDSGSGGNPVTPRPEAPKDDGPLASDARDDVSEVLDGAGAAVRELWASVPWPDLDGVPTVDGVLAEISEWIPEPPSLATPKWADICTWLDSTFDLILCETLGSGRVLPRAVPDSVTMQQGTTVVVNVGGNDFDEAGRAIYVQPNLLPNDMTSPDGLTTVEVTSFGNATIAADADFIGVTQFLYQLCTIDKHCATGSVLVDVISGPVPPVARPDSIPLVYDESRPDPPRGRSGINVLDNDGGAGLLLQSVDITNTGPVSVSWSTSGDISVSHSLPVGLVEPRAIDLDAATYNVPYTVCNSAGACDESVLTVLYAGASGPVTRPDFVEVGRQRFATADPLLNDYYAHNPAGTSLQQLRITGVRAAPGSEDAIREAPTHTNGAVQFFTVAHPPPTFGLIYTVCLIDSSGAVLADECVDETITARLTDREGPIAIDDSFTLQAGEVWSMATLDVIGPSGGGADEVWERPVGFRNPNSQLPDTVTLAWTHPGDPDSTPPTPPREADFALVSSADSISGLTDDGSAYLFLTPLTSDKDDLPPAGAMASFEYEICDVDPETEVMVFSLCDTATVTIAFTANPDVPVKKLNYHVGLFPEEQADGSVEYLLPTPSPTFTIEAKPEYSAALLGDDVEINWTSSVTVIPEPEPEPGSTRREVTGAVESINGEVIGNDFSFTPDIEIESRDVAYFNVEVCDDLRCGSAVSSMTFTPIDFHAVAALRKVGLFDEVIDLTEAAWFAAPADEVARVEIRSIDGEPVTTDGPNGAVAWGRLGDGYRLEVQADDNGVYNRLRAVVPDVGVRAQEMVTYQACAVFEAPRAEPVPLTHEICRDSFVLFDIDTEQNFQYAPAGRPNFPFDADTDPYVLFEIEESFGDLLAGEDVPAPQLGAQTLSGLDGLLEAFDVDVDGRYVAGATLRLRAGVDADGPFVDGASSIMIGIGGSGSFETTQTLGGVNATVAAQTSVVGTIEVALGLPGERLRLADLAAGVTPFVDYDALIGVQAELEAGPVRARPSAAVAVESRTTGPRALPAVVVVPVSIELPGATDGNGDPVTIELRGTLQGGVLRIVGVGEIPDGYLLDGVALTDIDIDLTVDDSTTSGTITALATMEQLGLNVPITITIDGTDVTATGTADLAGVEVGHLGAPYLTFDSGTIVVTAEGSTETGALNMSAELSNISADLLPGNPLGSAEISGLGGTIGTSGPQTLQFTALTATAGEYASINTAAGSIVIGGDPKNPVLVLTEVDALDTGGLTVRLELIEFYADGRVDIGAGCLAASAGLSDVIGLGGILPFDVTSACVNGSEITVEGFFDFSLMRDWPFTPSVTIGTQTVDEASDANLPENRFTFVFDAATLRPITLGPIQIGIDDFTTGGVTASGSMEIAGWIAGVFDGTITGTVDIASDGSVNELPIGGRVGAAIDGLLRIDEVTGATSLDLAVDLDVSGFIGDYLELTSGDLQLTTRVTVSEDLSVAIDGPLLESADLAGVVRISGLESSSDTGGIPVTVGYDNGDLVVTAGGGATYTAGGQTFTNVTGTVRVATSGGATSVDGLLTVGSLQGSLGDVVAYETGEGFLEFDSGAEPPLLRVEDVVAWIVDPDDVDGPPLAELTINFVEIRDDGTLRVGVIESTRLDKLANRFGFGAMFPFTVAGLRIDPTDLTNLTATVAGTFDLALLEAALPGDAPDASLTLGDGADGCDALGMPDNAPDTFCFTLALDALGGGNIVPIDFGPLRMILTGLDVGGVAGSASFEIAGYDSNNPVGFDGNFAGDVAVATDLGGQLSGDFTADFDGEIFPDGAGGASLAIQARVSAALVAGGAAGTANATFQLGIAVDSAGNFSVTGPTIDELEARLCVEVPGFSSDAACDGVYASVAKDGDIWTASVTTDVAFGAETNGLTVENLTGTLTLDASGSGAPRIVSGSMSASRVGGVLGGIIEVEVGTAVDPVEFTFDNNDSTPMISPQTITGRLLDGEGVGPDHALVQLEIVGFSIGDTGRLNITEIGVTELDELEAAIGISDLLPFGLSGVSVTIVEAPDVDFTTPGAYIVRAAGTFDLSAISHLGPVAQIGDGTSNGNCDGLGVDPSDEPDYGGTFCFALAIDGDGVRPLDFGPIKLGLTSVEVGPFAFGGTIEVGGYGETGAWAPIPEDLNIPGGTSDVRGRLTASVLVDDEDTDDTGDKVSAKVELIVAGDFSTDAQGRTTLVLDGQLAGGFNIDDIIVLEGATVTFGLGLRLDTRTGVQLDVLNAEAHSLYADLVRVGVPDLFSIKSTNVSFPLEDGLIVSVPSLIADGSVEISFGDPDAGDSGSPIDGWRGAIGGFEVDFKGNVYLLEGFGTKITAGDAGFPDFLPITINELGIVFRDDVAANLVASLGGGERVPLSTVVDSLLISGSMSISHTSDLPVDASVDDLEIDIKLLRDWSAWLAEDAATPGGSPAQMPPFFITNLDGLFFGIDELKIGPVKVSGGLGIGVADTLDGPKFWGRIVGGFAYQGYGLGVDILISEYGPLSFDVTVPAAMVLGPTGIVVAVTDVGVSFNSAPPSICTRVVDGVFDCDDGDDTTDDPVNPVDAAKFKPSAGVTDIGAAIDLLAEAAVDLPADERIPLLPDSFGVYVTGSISHIAIAGLVQGQVDFAMYFQAPPSERPLDLPGVKLVLRGDVDWFGASLGNLVIYADYGDPLAPAWTIAGAVAGGGDLLDLFFPIGASVALTLDTDGLAAATVLAVRELVIALVAGSLESDALANAFGPALDRLIDDMRTNPNSQLRTLLYGNVPDEQITNDSFRDRLVALLPGPAIVSANSDDTEFAQLLDNAEADWLVAVDVASAVFAGLADAYVALLRGDGPEPPPLSPAENEAVGQELIAALQEFLADAPGIAGDVGQVVYEVANPALVSQARVQFELFDIPVGEPALESTLVINKEGVFAQFDGSFTKLTAAAATFVNAAGAILIPLAYAVADQTNFGLSFPFRFEDFLAGEGVDVFDPREGEWAISTGSDFYLMGFEVSAVDGIIAPGASERQVADWELASGRAVPNNAGPNSDVNVRDLLTTSGGLYAQGEISVPDLIADPLGWWADFQDTIDNVPTELLDWPDFFKSAKENLLNTQPAGNMELFVEAPRYNPAAGPPTKPAAWTWSGNQFFQNEMGVDLLGYRVLNSSLEATESGFDAEITFPYFGAPLRANINTVAIVGKDLADGDEGQIRWPAVSIDQQITVSDVRALLEAVGIDGVIPDGVAGDSFVRLRGFSPAHHLTADDPATVAETDPIRVTGGLEIIVGADVAGVFEAGEIAISVGFGTGGLSPKPSFVEARIGAEVFDFGGVTLREAELTFRYDREALPAVDIDVNGIVDVFGNSLRVTGSLATGVLSAEFAQPVEVGGLIVSNIDDKLRGPSVTLRRIGANGVVQLEVAAAMQLDGWRGRATINTVVGSGSDLAVVTLSQFRRGGLALDGQAAFRTTDSGFEFVLDGARLSVAALGIDNVTISGRLTEAGVQSLSFSGVEFDLGPGADISCAAGSATFVGNVFRLTGSAGISVAGLTDETDKPVVIGGGKGDPFSGCTHSEINATFDVGSDGYGSIELADVTEVGIGPLVIDVTTASVSRTAGTGTELLLAGSVEVLRTPMSIGGIARFVIASDGLAGSARLKGEIPDLYGWRLSGAVSLDVAPGQDPRFGLNGSVIPPFTAGSISVGPDSFIGSGANPSFLLDVTANQLTFAGDAVTVDGTLQVYRAGGEMTLRVSNASIDVGPLGDVPIASSSLVLNGFTVRSNGAFSLDDLTISKIGNNELAFVNGRLDLDREANGNFSFRLHGGSVVGTALNGQSFDVDPISVEFNSGFGSGFRKTIEVPALTLGAALTTTPFDVAVSVSRRQLTLDQGDAVTATVLGSPLTLSDLFVRYRSSNGVVTVEGSLKGNLVFLGRPITNAELSISNDGPHLRLDLEAGDPINLGPLGTINVDGWARSDGHFELTAAFVRSFGVSGNVDGNVVMGFDEDGPRFRFSGKVTTPVGSGQGTARISSDNVLVGSFSYRIKGLSGTFWRSFSFPVGIRAAPDSNSPPPVFAGIPDSVSVEVAPNSPASAPVYFSILINLDAADADTVACSPGDGSLFEVGATTEVLCVAAGDGGTADVTFDVVVTRAPQTFSIGILIPLGPGGGTATGPPSMSSSGSHVLTQGSTVTTTGRGDAGTPVRMVLRSEPLEVAAVVVGADGTWTATFVVPESLPVGEHTLVVDSIIGGQRTLTQINVELAVPAPVMPDTGLPATGSESLRGVPIALLLFALGVLLLAASRRRRRLA